MKKKFFIIGIVAIVLTAILILVLKFTRKQTNGIADGKYVITDCPEYPEAYIKIKNDTIQIFNLDVNSIYRAEQVENVKKCVPMKSWEYI